MNPETARLLQIIYDNPDQFRDNFAVYLFNNIPLWNEFVKIAFRLINAGVTHYSCRAIIHIIRYHTIVGDTETKFKVSNNWTADISRLFMLRYPQYDGFFRTKESTQRAALHEDEYYD